MRVCVCEGGVCVRACVCVKSEELVEVGKMGNTCSICGVGSGDGVCCVCEDVCGCV